MDDVSPREGKEMPGPEPGSARNVAVSGDRVLTARCQLSARPIGPGRFDITLNGTLRLHGVSRSQPILAHVVAGEGTLRSYGELAVRRSDYGLRDMATAGNMIRLKDEVKLAFDIVARRQ